MSYERRDPCLLSVAQRRRQPIATHTNRVAQGLIAAFHGVPTSTRHYKPLLANLAAVVVVRFGLRKIACNEKLNPSIVGLALASVILITGLSSAPAQTSDGRIDQCLDSNTEPSISYSACNELLSSPSLDENIAGLIFFRTGELQSQSGLYNEAITSFTQSLEYGHEAYLSYVWRGDSHFNNGHLDEAEADYLHASILQPDQSLAHSRLGALYFALGEIEESLSSLDAAIELNPTEFRYHFLSSLGRFQTDQIQRGFSDIDLAIELASGNPTLYVIRALNHFNTGDINSAWNDLDSAAEIDPQYFFMRVYSGVFNTLEQNWLTAWSDFDALTRDFPEDANFYMARSLLSVELGHYSDATEDCLEASRLDRSLLMMLVLSGLRDCTAIAEFPTTSEWVEETGSSPLYTLLDAISQTSLMRRELWMSAVDPSILVGTTSYSL